VQNKSQANKECDTWICFTEVRFLQTYSPLRWSQRPGLFQPFPSLKRSLGPSELSLLKCLEHKVPTRTTTRLVSLASITSEFVKGKCALGPFLNILVIECQRKCFCVDLCNVVDKMQIMSKGMFLRLSTLF
jgi:hypothetical protein